jgi:hypothetical protein
MSVTVRALYIFSKGKVHSAHKFETLGAEMKPWIFNILAISVKPYDLVISEGFRPFFSASIIKKAGLAKNM